MVSLDAWGSQQSNTRFVKRNSESEQVLGHCLLKVANVEENKVEH